MKDFIISGLGSTNDGFIETILSFQWGFIIIPPEIDLNPIWSMTNVDTLAPGNVGSGSYGVNFICGPRDMGLEIYVVGWGSKTGLRSNDA